MQEKFFELSNGLRWLIIVLSWLLTAVGFGGCLVVKQFTEDLLWLEVVLTVVGMFFCVVAVCITIVQLTLGKKEKVENSENSL